MAEATRKCSRAIDDLLTAEHDFKTLVIDTVDRLEPLLWAYICERDSKRFRPALVSSIESYGYGKGYQHALDEWRALCGKLDQLRTKRGMSVVFVGHAQVKTFHNPEGDDYDRYSLRLHEKASGFVREWCDVLGFCCFEGGAGKLADDSKRDKVKGYATGRRLIRLERTAAYDAKSRLPLPPHVELSQDAPWKPFAEAAAMVQEIGQGLTAEQLRQSVQDELVRIGDKALTESIHTVLEEHGNDTNTLIRLISKLKGK